MKASRALGIAILVTLSASVNSVGRLTDHKISIATLQDSYTIVDEDYKYNNILNPNRIAVDIG